MRRGKPGETLPWVGVVFRDGSVRHQDGKEICALYPARHLPLKASQCSRMRRDTPVQPSEFFKLTCRFSFCSHSKLPVRLTYKGLSEVLPHCLPKSAITPGEDFR
jgi:hypothetical protein